MLNLVLVGGDERMSLAAGLLAERGHSVRHIRNGEAAERQLLAEADALVLPYPFTVKEGGIPGWQGGGVKTLLEMLRPGTDVLHGAGFPDERALAVAAAGGLHLHSYADDPLFLRRNAEISAEAAVCAAMERSGRMLDELRVLVTGYGLFGKAIAWRLLALGARVWVAARRDTQRKQAASDGMKPVPLEEIPQIAPCMDLVLNTVPAVILQREQLACFAAHTLFLELASPPYGIHLAAAAELNQNVAVLPGLPAQYAPLSAACAVRDAILRRIGEE